MWCDVLVSTVCPTGAALPLAVITNGAQTVSTIKAAPSFGFGTGTREVLAWYSPSVQIQCPFAGQVHSLRCCFVVLLQRTRCKAVCPKAGR